MDNYRESTEFTGQLVEAANNLATWSMSSGDNLVYYLKSLSHFPDYSVNNQLLVMGYKPDAVYIKGQIEWEGFGISVSENATPIYIIEPVEKNSFQVKTMYDYTDTNYRYEPAAIDKLTALEALLTNNLNSITVVDEIKRGVRAMYMPNERQIQVKRSSRVSPDEFFTAIAAEMVHYNMAGDSEGVYKRASNQITAICTAYSLGLKYGMDVSNISLKNLPEKYTAMSAKTVKNEFARIKDNFNLIDKNMDIAIAKIKERDESINAR